MPLTEKQFAEYLQCFGTQINTWPEALQVEAMRAARIPPFASMLDRQRRFEALLATHPVPPARPELAERILAACPVRQPVPSLADWLLDLLASLMLPRPAYSLAAVLALGLVIGFSTPALLQGNQYTVIQPYLEDDGAVP